MDTRSMTLGVRNGDKAAFDAFYDRYADRMYRYLLVSSGGKEDRAREAHQETLLRVIRHMKPIGTETELWAFLTVIMRSSFIDLIRRDRRAPTTLAVPLAEDRNAPAEDEATDRLHRCLNEALLALPEDDRALLQAHYFGGETQVGLAGRWGENVKALGMRLSRLRRRLRDSILERIRRE